MQINIEVANTPESIELTKNQLVKVVVERTNKKIETFVVSLDDLHDIGYYDYNIPETTIFAKLVSLQKQKVLQ